MIQDVEYSEMLVEVGIISPEDKIRRVTIDVCAGETVMIYIEKYADGKIIKLMGKLGEALKEV